MKKRTVIVVMLVLLVISTVVVAEEDSQECGFFCQIGEWWNSFTGENVAGER